MLKLSTKFAPELSGFELAWEAGYRYAEFWLDQKILQNLDDTIRLSKSYPFGYALHCPNQLDLSQQTLENLTILYRETRASCLIIHDLQFARYSAWLKQLSPEMVLAVENHEFSWDQFMEWQDGYDFLTLDIEHLWLFTLQSGSLSEVCSRVRDFLGKSGPKLKHVHLPGYSPGNIEHRPMYCSRDFVFAMFDLLGEFDFQGLIVSEVEMQFQNPQDLLMDRLLFDRWRHMKQDVLT